MLIFTHPACLEHDPGPEHPERPARLESVLSALRETYADLDWREAPAAKLGDLCRVHDRIGDKAAAGLQEVLGRPAPPPG